jgi:hypothetical protein
MSRSLARVAIGLAAGVLVSACGSTVAGTAQSQAGQQGGGQLLGAPTADGLGVTPGSPAPVAPGTDPFLGGAGTAGGVSSGGSDGSAGSPSEPTTDGGVGSAPGGSVGGAGTAGAGLAGGPGVTDTTIALGIPYCNDCAAGNAAAGASGQDPGDTRRYYQAALDDVNSRGGVQGRKLVPVFHEISIADNIDASAQAACSTWTEDSQVLAMFLQGEITYQCAAKAGVMAVGAGGSGPLFERYTNMFAPATIRLERLGAVTVKAMVKVGWHKPEPTWPTGRIGLITWDDSEYEYAMRKGWLPALHASGLKETDVRYIAVPQNANSLADASAAISNAILAFREKGIDHVFISDGNAGIFKGNGLTFLFLQNAESQRYYPRYGFNGNNLPGWENYPAKQQVGMLAIDNYDTEPADDEGIAPNRQRDRCWEIMRKKGLPVGDTQTQTLAIGACEAAWFAEAVFPRARSAALPDVIAAGESLGTSYRSPYTYGTRLGPGQHDGVSLFRSARYDEACSCMRYTSKPFEP